MSKLRLVLALATLAAAGACASRAPLLSAAEEQAPAMDSGPAGADSSAPYGGGMMGSGN